MNPYSDVQVCVGVTVASLVFFCGLTAASWRYANNESRSTKCYSALSQIAKHVKDRLYPIIAADLSQNAMPDYAKRLAEALYQSPTLRNTLRSFSSAKAGEDDERDKDWLLGQIALVARQESSRVDLYPGGDTPELEAIYRALQGELLGPLHDALILRTWHDRVTTFLECAAVLFAIPTGAALLICLGAMVVPLRPWAGPALTIAAIGLALGLIVGGVGMVHELRVRRMARRWIPTGEQQA